MATSFRFLVERDDVGDVEQLCWCPNKDVCALLSRAGSVWLQRAGSGDTWQSLVQLTIPPADQQRHVTSLCWRPDGSCLACGLSDGFLTIFDAEEGACIFHEQVVQSRAPVQALNWIAERPRPAAAPAPSHHLDLDLADAIAHDLGWETNPPTAAVDRLLNVLVVSTAAGDVWLRLGGILMRIGQPQSAEQSQIIDGSVLDQSNSMEGSVLDQSNAMDGSVLDQSNAMDGSVLDQSNTMDGSVLDQSNVMDGSVLDQSNAMDGSVLEQSNAMDGSVLEQSNAMDGSVLEQSNVMDGSVLDQSNTMDGSVLEQSRTADEPTILVESTILWSDLRSLTTLVRTGGEQLSLRRYETSALHDNAGGLAQLTQQTQQVHRTLSQLDQWVQQAVASMTDLIRLNRQKFEALSNDLRTFLPASQTVDLQRVLTQMLVGGYVPPQLRNANSLLDAKSITRWYKLASDACSKALSLLAMHIRPAVEALHLQLQRIDSADQRASPPLTGALALLLSRRRADNNGDDGDWLADCCAAALSACGGGEWSALTQLLVDVDSEAHRLAGYHRDLCLFFDWLLLQSFPAGSALPSLPGDALARLSRLFAAQLGGLQAPSLDAVHQSLAGVRRAFNATLDAAAARFQRGLLDCTSIDVPPELQPADGERLLSAALFEADQQRYLLLAFDARAALVPLTADSSAPDPAAVLVVAPPSPGHRFLAVAPYCYKTKPCRLACLSAADDDDKDDDGATCTLSLVDLDGDVVDSRQHSVATADKLTMAISSGRGVAAIIAPGCISLFDLEDVEDDDDENGENDENQE